MISYIDTIDGIAAEHLQGFFVGWPYTGMILRNYDRQSGAP
jgi:hypothetical protein